MKYISVGKIFWGKVKSPEGLFNQDPSDSGSLTET